MAIEVTDDSGFLAIIDPESYRGFVDEDWSLEQLVAHFKSEMSAKRLLIWGTGREGIWRVQTKDVHSSLDGHRAIVGSIEASSGQLLLTNYESLTMAAQFEDVTLPEPHQRDNLLSLPSSAQYNCRVVQVLDPDGDETATEPLDFLLEFEPTSEPVRAWDRIPWSDI